MSGQLDSLYRLQKTDVRRAGTVLAEAFEQDPVWTATMGELPLEKRAYAFETPVRYCLHYGGVYAPSERLEGVAAWAPGEVAEMTFWRVLRSGSMWPGMKLGAKVARKMMPVFQPDK